MKGIKSAIRDVVTTKDEKDNRGGESFHDDGLKKVGNTKSGPDKRRVNQGE